MKRMVILGSGRGSNARALLEAEKAGELGSVECVAIFSDRKEAPILELGPRFGVAAFHIDPGPFKTKLSEDAELRFVDAIKRLEPDIIVLAGFMRVLKPTFLNAFPMRIINLHPSLLPSFKGLAGIRQAYEYGVKITGCTIHYVTADLDGGPIIDQEAVRILPGETLEQLEVRVHAAEHQLLPRVVRSLFQVK